MLRGTLLLTLLALVGCGGSSAAEGVERVLDDAEAAGFSGTVLVVAEGETLAARSFGLADRERGIANTADTVYVVGSIVKDFTAVAVLRLVEQGKLELDARLETLLTRVPRDKRAITVRQLLRHRAGLPEYHPGRGDFDSLTRAQSVREILAAPLLFPPGKREAYSNPGYTLLAAIVEQVAGRPYVDVVRETVFQPAGMSDTGFWGHHTWHRERVAVGYGPMSRGTRNAPDAWGRASWTLLGAGGAAGTVGDLARFVVALRGGKLLRPPSVTLFYRLSGGPGAEGAPVIAYGGATSFGFNVTVAELRTREGYVVVATNTLGGRRLPADELSRKLVDVLVPRRNA